MRQRLIVKRDRLGIDGDPELFDELERRQLPQPTEQPLRAPAREDDLAAGFDPHERPRQHR